MTKVSIIIPVYNVAPYVRQCIQSVLTQSYKNIEVIIIDDCGTDNSMGIIETTINESQINNDTTIRILTHDHNLGLSAARNTGIEAATGDWIYFLDSDDYISPTCIELLVRAAEKDPSLEMVVGDYYDTNGHRFSLQVPSKIQEESLLHAICTRKVYNMVWNKIVSKKWIVSNNFTFEEGLIHEDVLWSFVTSCSNPRYVIVPEVTYYYRIREGSIQKDKALLKHHKAYSFIAIQIMNYSIHHNIYKKEVIDYIEEYIRICFFYPLWNNIPEYSRSFYKELRKSCNVGFFNCVKLCISKKPLYLHFLLPVNLGYKWYLLFSNWSRKNTR